MPQETYFISTKLEMGFIKNKQNKLLAGNWCVDNLESSKICSGLKTLKNIWSNKIEKRKIINIFKNSLYIIQKTFKLF